MDGSKKLQYLAGFLSTISLFIGGSFVGWSSPIGAKMNSNQLELKCSEADWGWITASIAFGCIFGSLAAGKLADTLGRKTTLLICAPIYLIGWVVTYLASHCYFLYVARITGGIGLGISSAVCAVYIGEITEPTIRGQVCGLVMLMHNIGVVFSLAIGPFVSYKTFALILSIFPLLFFVSFSLMRETPFFHLRQKNRGAAMKSLLDLRGLSDEKLLEKELDEMQDAVECELLNKSTFGELISDENRKALITVLGVKTLQHLSGISAIQSNLQTIFQQTNSPIPPQWAGISCGLMQLLGGTLSNSVVDRCGRKPLLLFSAFGTSLSLFFVGLYFFLQDVMQMDVSLISWLPFVSIMGFMAFQTLGIGSVAYVLLGELFPTNLKGVAVTTCTAYGSFGSFVITKVFSLINEFYEMFATFWLCGAITVAGIVFIWAFVMETKGKTLMEIQKQLKAGGKIKYENTKK